jgi:magnesium transporter
MTRITSAGSKLRLNGAKFLLYSVLDTLVDHVFLVVRTLEAKLELHQKAIHKMISIEAIKSLGALQKELDRMEQWFSPMMVVISRLQNVLVVEDDNLRRYLIDLQEHVITQRDTVTSLGKWARSLNQIYVNEQQYHINQAVYILTVITSVFIPAQFLTGVYGMNFDNMPELHWKYSYLVFWIVVIVLTFLVCFSFWKKGWFKF